MKRIIKFFRDMDLIKDMLFCMIENQMSIMRYLRADAMFHHWGDYAVLFSIRLEESDEMKWLYRKGI